MVGARELTSCNFIHGQWIQSFRNKDMLSKKINSVTPALQSKGSTFMLNDFLLAKQDKLHFNKILTYGKDGSRESE
jgi:hypothetical protein